MIVVDASAVLEVLLRTSVAPRVEARLFGRQTLHAPHLLDVEVAQVLRRYASRATSRPRAGRRPWLIWPPFRSTAIRLTCC